MTINTTHCKNNQDWNNSKTQCNHKLFYCCFKTPLQKLGSKEASWDTFEGSWLSISVQDSLLLHIISVSMVIHNYIHKLQPYYLQAQIKVFVYPVSIQKYRSMTTDWVSFGISCKNWLSGAAWYTMILFWLHMQLTVWGTWQCFPFWKSISGFRCWHTAS